MFAFVNNGGRTGFHQEPGAKMIEGGAGTVLTRSANDASASTATWSGQPQGVRRITSL